MSSKNDGLKEKLVFITAIVIKELQSGVKSRKHLRSLMPSGHYNYSMGDALDLLCVMDFIKEVEIEVPHENSSIIGYELKTKEDIEKERDEWQAHKEFLDTLGLRVKTCNKLLYNNIKSIEELQKHDDMSLLQLKLIHYKDVVEIKTALEKIGKSLSG